MRSTPESDPGPDALRRLSIGTITHYRSFAQAYRQGTWHHDVSQNIAALLDAIEGTPPSRILDLGCGPGRDLVTFRSSGHAPIGLDACPEFVDMARRLAICEVWLQDMLALDLPAEQFDGVFANAVLFHVPSQALPRVLSDLWATLKPDGVLFASNPRGRNEEGWADERYACFYDLSTWQCLVEDAGFALLDHYFRPPGKPRHQQPWLATVWRKRSVRPGG